MVIVAEQNQPVLPSLSSYRNSFILRLILDVNPGVMQLSALSGRLLRQGRPRVVFRPPMYAQPLVGIRAHDSIASVHCAAGTRVGFRCPSKVFAPRVSRQVRRRSCSLWGVMRTPPGPRSIVGP